jgi:hypothetical protein
MEGKGTAQIDALGNSPDRRIRSVLNHDHQASRIYATRLLVR